MHRSGFTIIEILAVVVILAVIALIASPLIMNAIEKSQKNAAKESAYGYIKAVEYKIASEKINSPAYIPPTTLIIADDQNLQFHGTRPTVVSLELTNGIVDGGIIVINNYTMTIGVNGKVIQINPE